MSLVARRTVSSWPASVRDLDDRMERGGYVISDDGLGFERIVRSSRGSVAVRVASRAENRIDGVELEIRTEDENALPEIMRIADGEATRLTRVAQLGYPGGAGGLWNVNQDEGLGGPRWWLYDQMLPDIKDLEKWIQGQFRYNPSFMMTPDAMPEEIHWEPLATIKGDVNAARLVHDRQNAVLEVKKQDPSGGPDKISKVELKGYDTQETRDPGHSGVRNELAQEMDKYQVGIVRSGTGKSVVLVRKVDERGDNKGIYEINGRPSSGIAHIEEDGTSYSLHPEYLDDKQWTQGIGPGVVGYIPKY